MDSAFSNLKVSPNLACEFLGVFARSEYALKAAGFAVGDEKQVHPDWNAFAKAIGDNFDQSESQEVCMAVDYLLTNPPKKQVLRNNTLEFSEAPRTRTKAERIKFY